VPPHQWTPLFGQAMRLPRVASKAGQQFQPPLALNPRRTVPTPVLGRTTRIFSICQ